MNEMQRQTITVIGCGNPYAGDDAAGVKVVEALRRAAPEDLCLRLVDDLGPGFLCDVEYQGSIVILVDAVRSAAAIGTVHFVRLPSASVIPRNVERISTHALGLDREIELASSYGKRTDAFLLGIEIGDHCIGESLSPAVSAAVERVVADFNYFCGYARSQTSSHAPLYSGKSDKT